MENYLKMLKAFGPLNIDVAHNPMTARYWRAFDERTKLVAHAQVLGVRKHESGAVELATFLQPLDGRSRPGAYACFRMYFDTWGTLVGVKLFCYYDGKEGSPRLMTLASAQAFARDNGFGEIPP